VIVRVITSRGSGGGGAILIKPPRAPASVEAGSGGRAGPSRRGRGLRVPAEEPPARLPLPEDEARVAESPVLEQPGPQLRFRVGLGLERYRDRPVLSGQHGLALDQDELSRYGHEPGDAADTIVRECGQGIEIRLGEAAQRDGQDLELTALNQGKEQSQRPVEVLDANVRRGVRPALA
jgi:hypothetical protein